MVNGAEKWEIAVDGEGRGSEGRRRMKGVAGGVKDDLGVSQLKATGPSRA